jgi:hypothetical protein
MTQGKEKEQQNNAQNATILPSSPLVACRLSLVCRVICFAKNAERRRRNTELLSRNKLRMQHAVAGLCRATNYERTKEVARSIE